MNVFKVAYKVVRENSNEIYKGFGFKHLSDGTQYYVHPDNQSFKGKTTLCQPIGEAVILFAEMLKSMKNGKIFGDYYLSDDRKNFYIEINVPEDYRASGVVESNVFRYCALSNDTEISIAAYDENGRWIEGDMEHLHPLYKLLPVFAVLLAGEMETNTDFRSIMEEFTENPTQYLLADVLGMDDSILSMFFGDDSSETTRSVKRDFKESINILDSVISFIESVQISGSTYSWNTVIDLSSLIEGGMIGDVNVGLIGKAEEGAAGSLTNLLISTQLTIEPFGDILVDANFQFDSSKVFPEAEYERLLDYFA